MILPKLCNGYCHYLTIFTEVYGVMYLYNFSINWRVGTLNAGTPVSCSTNPTYWHTDVQQKGLIFFFTNSSYHIRTYLSATGSNLSLNCAIGRAANQWLHQVWTMSRYFFLMNLLFARKVYALTYFSLTQL